jgi:quinol-cytochrome oxidoreductase complex cytochrome b subunit
MRSANMTVVAIFLLIVFTLPWDQSVEVQDSTADWFNKMLGWGGEPANGPEELFWR